MISFLTGCITAALLERFSNISLPQPLLLLSIFFLVILFITLNIITSYILRRFCYPIKNAKVACILCYLVFFLSGVTNMQRKGKINLFSEPVRSSFENITQNIKGIFSIKLEELIPDKTDRAVVAAFTIGDKSEIPYNIKKAYRDTGAAHVLALSGLHTGIIYGIIDLLLFFLNFNYKSRRIKFFISATAIFSYALITGLSASVQRAAIMIIIWKLQTLSNRKATRWSAWLISASLILLANPQEMYNIGFQLSFAAVAGIISIFPIISRASELWADFRFSRLIKPIWELAGISVACQIATLPLIICYFNSSPTYFLITNMAAIPLVTCSLYALAAASVTGSIPLIGDLSAFLLQKSISLLNFIIAYIGS